MDYHLSVTPKPACCLLAWLPSQVLSAYFILKAQQPVSTFLLYSGTMTYNVTLQFFHKYFAALEDWDTRQNLASLRDFLKDQTENTLEMQLA